MSTESDYCVASKMELTDINRWQDGIEHHPMSVRIMEFLMEHDFCDYDDHFCWKKAVMETTEKS